MTTPEDYYLRHNQLFEKLLASPLGPDMRKRYAKALDDGAYKLERLLELLDAMVAEVSASARRDEAKWLAMQRPIDMFPPREDYLTYDEEVEYVRKWIIDRHALLQRSYNPVDTAVTP